MVNSKYTIIILSVFLIICLGYIFVIPIIDNYYMNKANLFIINNIVYQLQNKGYIDFKINNQTLRLIPEVV